MPYGGDETQMLAKPKAVLWDFDGTLVDTEPIWAELEAEMLAEHGVVWDDEMMRSVIGQNAEMTTRQMAVSIGQPDRHQDIHRELHDRIVGRLLRDGLPFLPGTLDLIEAAEADGVSAAVVTASNGFIMNATRELLPPSIQFVISADDVVNTKPHPEAYLTAMARLGVAPEETIVLEDSVPGATSALAAGAFVYAVPALAQLDPHPRMVVSETALRETTWPELLQIWHDNSKVGI